MPKKEFYQYRNEFVNSLYKYGLGKVTPEIYQKELLKYIKSKMDHDFEIINIYKFINETALSVTTKNSQEPKALAADKDLYPSDFYAGLFASNILSKKVVDALNSTVNKRQYLALCDSVANEKGTGTKEALIEYKVNKFKLIEGLKPTGNAFTKFFKKAFNIGGYNDKLAAYNTCKQSILESIGDQMTPEQFEESIHSQEPYRHKTKVKEKALDVKELDEKQEVQKEDSKVDELEKGKKKVIEEPVQEMNK